MRRDCWNFKVEEQQKMPTTKRCQQRFFVFLKFLLDIFLVGKYPGSF